MPLESISERPGFSAAKSLLESAGLPTEELTELGDSRGLGTGLALVTHAEQAARRARHS
jgi:hypothetical protein